MITEYQQAGGKKEYSEKLLAWYAKQGRVLPWRFSPPDPYAVLVSEFMLQQTVVATVKDYYTRFMNRWPGLCDLAEASLDDVLFMWQGLGYYARARNLHECAQRLMENYGGRLPEGREELLALPGIGDYTASIMRALLFNGGDPVIDGNVKRVMARLFAIQTVLPEAMGEIRKQVIALTPETRRGDYAQAVMDLGASVCRAGLPDCPACPWQELCLGKDFAGELPRRLKKKKRPLKKAVVFILISGPDKALLCRKRPYKGLLAGTVELPSSAWQEYPSDFTFEALLEESPDGQKSGWRLYNPAYNPGYNRGGIKHIFTHFQLELFPAVKIIDECKPIDGHFWLEEADFERVALSSLMQKVLGFCRGLDFTDGGLRAANLQKGE